MEPNSISPVEQNKSKTLLVSVVVVVLIIIAIVFYFWRNANISNNESAIGSINEINALNAQGTSDDITSIEVDLQATNLDNLDKEVPAIDAALDTTQVK